MPNPLLEVQDLKVVYKTDLETVHAVNGISFTLNHAETLGIVGETGAGKTTTALSIMRLLPWGVGRVLQGKIIFMGKDILALDEKEIRNIRGKNISMIFQDPMTSLNPLETVGDQIAEALMLHSSINSMSNKNRDIFYRIHTFKRRQEIDARVDEVLTLVGIPPFRKKEYPHQFSGGMKQRIVIATALACEPALLIADEPTTALDVTIQAQVLAMIDDLRRKHNTAMIMITHDLGIIAQTCDKVAVMYAGEIVEYGFVEDVFEAKNNHPYTQGLFGSILNVEIETKRLSPIMGLMPDPTNLPIGCRFAERCPFCMDICREKHPSDYQDGTHIIKCFLYDPNISKKKVGWNYE